MNVSDTRCFPARMSALPEVLACVREACLAARFAEAMTLRVELVLEELVTNSICHGYGGDSEAPLWLHTAALPGSLIVTYEDAAAPYDPLAHDANVAESLDQRGVGGLGIHLARQLTNAITYRRADERNVLTLTFRTEAR